MSTVNARTVGPLESRFNNIMNARPTDLTLGHAGQVVRCRVAGTPQLGWYDERLQALKDIYSFNVNKMSVVDSPWFAENHAKAIALEAAGQADAAAILFNDLLNKSQLSHGIINRDGTKTQFASGQTVDLAIGTAKVEDKIGGVGTGTFHTALIVASISPVAALIVGKTKRFGEPLVSEPATAPAVPAAEMAAIAQPSVS